MTCPTPTFTYSSNTVILNLTAGQTIDLSSYLTVDIECPEILDFKTTLSGSGNGMITGLPNLGVNFPTSGIYPYPSPVIYTSGTLSAIFDITISKSSTRADLIYDTITIIICIDGKCICFHPDSILLVNGDEKKTIKDIEEGDTIVDENGKLLKITRLHYYKSDPHFYQVDDNVLISSRHYFKPFRRKLYPKPAFRGTFDKIESNTPYAIQLETDGDESQYFIRTSDNSLFSVEVWGRSNPNSEENKKKQ